MDTVPVECRSQSYLSVIQIRSSSRPRPACQTVCDWIRPLAQSGPESCSQRSVGVSLLSAWSSISVCVCVCVRGGACETLNRQHSSVKHQCVCVCVCVCARACVSHSTQTPRNSAV